MKNKVISLDGFTESLASFCKFKDEFRDDEGNQYKDMIKILKNVMDGELTKRQKDCVMMYYGERRKMREISKSLGIGISSVSRHIKRARMRIYKMMKYYYRMN